MFKGSFTVMVTPFQADGSLDEATLRKFVDWQIEQGTQGLIPLGSTGEFLSQTREERRRVATIVVEQARKRLPVIVGTAAEWTEEAVAFSRDAQEAGADGVMIVPPYYSSPTPDELFVHYRKIGQALSIPIMVYNNPFTSNVDLDAALVARLCEIDNVRYIKESSGDPHRTTRILDACGDRITVFAGYHPWEGFRIGAKGYVSVFANIAPAMSRALYEETVNSPDIQRGFALYRKVLPLMDAIAGDLYVGATKAAMGMVGMPVGHPRPPRLPLPEEKLPNLRAVLSSLGLLKQARGSN
jgi:4-hydroxy-tetrahydrodipicolinate synthase